MTCPTPRNYPSEKPDCVSFAELDAQAWYKNSAGNKPGTSLPIIARRALALRLPCAVTDRSLYKDRRSVSSVKSS